MRLSNLDFGIDFDGTCVTHEFPLVGRDIGAQKVLKRIVAEGGRLILNTMRSGGTLDDAVKWFERNNIPLYGINENPTQKDWTTSPKVFAKVYIDDAGLGCPLLVSGINERPYVNWDAIEKMIFG